MKIGIVYSKKNKQAQLLVNDLIKEVRSIPVTMEDFNFNESYDYLVIVYEQSLNNKQIKELINQLSKNYVKNVSLIYMYKLSDKYINKMVDLTHKNDIPLMRETYTCKIPLLSKPYLKEEVLSRGRTYINDMVTIIHNYY